MDNTKYLSPRAYEMMAVLLPDQGDEETSAAIEKMLGYITEQQGTVDSAASDSPWGRRRLAYTIRHEGVDYRDGHYVLVYFTAMPSAISEIERELKLDTNVIRYLLLTHDPHMGEQVDVTAADAEAAAEGDESATEETPAEATQAPVEEAATENAPVEAADAPAEEAAIENAPVEAADAPVDEAVAEEVPATDEATTEEPAAEDAIADEAPVEEATTEESDTDGEVEESAEA